MVRQTIRRKTRKTPRKKSRKGRKKRAERKPATSLARRIGVPVFAATTAVLVLTVALVLPLRWVDPPTSAFMLADRSGRVPVLYEWVDWAFVGSAVPLAVVAAEDQRFADHPGFDIDAIGDALSQAEAGDRLRGASTISQQLGKNLYLWNGRSYLRKGIEAWFTVFLELLLPKRRILELYINVIEVGPGVYGVAAGSWYFFGKPPAALADREAALMAAVLPNPHRLRIDAPSAYVRDRQQWIAEQMARLRREGWLSRL